MGKKNNAWHVFLQDEGRFADMVNAFALDGAQRVKAKDVVEADSKAGSKSRDEVRRVIFGINFAFIGIESQETIDYSMVIRNMYYDAVRYDDERKKIIRARRDDHADNERKSDVRNVSCEEKICENEKICGKAKSTLDGEYLYRFRKEDKIHPVVTFVVYCGKEPWDAAISIKELMDITDIPGEFMKYVSDYKINVIDVMHGDYDKIGKLRTDVKLVLDFIRCSNDKEKLRTLLSNTDDYENMTEEAYNLTEKYAKIKNLKRIRNKEGGCDMCKAIEDMRLDSWVEGKAEGEAIGEIRGEIKAYNKMNLSISEIAERTGRTEEYIIGILKESKAVVAAV